MKVHHLNCGTMHPPRSPHCVCHVLLLETDNGLVLVDSGFGIDDCAATDVIRKVGRGEVEFGIASGDIANAELHIEPLTEDPFRLVCRRTDPIAASGVATWSQLSGRKLVMLNNTSGSRQVIEATLTRTRTRVDVLLELAQPSSILGMVEAGIGKLVQGLRRDADR